MKFRSFFSLITLSLFLLAGSETVQAQPAPLEGFDEYANQAIKDWEVPGVAIAVVKDDKIFYAKGYGVRELGKNAPVTDQTLFAIGSASKAFTAAAISILADEKKIKWDDKATKYLPGFQLYDPWVTRELTVRDLVTHRVGLERGDFLWYAADRDRDEILHQIRYLVPSSSMRTRFGYQNIMYLAAGQIIPSITGKTWDDFIAERFFAPLRMKDSGTSILTQKNSNDVATPHAKINDKVTPIAWRNIDNIAPAGSINSNVTDMAQWIRLQLGKGKYEGKQLVSEAMIKESHSPQTIIKLNDYYSRVYPEAHFFSYGFGWFLSDYHGRKLVEHGGAIDGMRAAVMMIPEENVGVVVLTNRGGSLLPQFLGYRVLDAFLGTEKKDWSAVGLKFVKENQKKAKEAAEKMEAERVKGTKPSVALSKYAGIFENEMYGKVNIGFENGKLTAHFGPNFNGDLEHWNYDTFRIKWHDEVLGRGFASFSLNRKGQVESVEVQNLDVFRRAKKKDK